MSEPAYYLFGVAIPAEDARAADDGVTVREPGGECVTRWRTASAKPLDTCRCGHGHQFHTYGSDRCWNAACGCSYFRKKDA